MATALALSADPQGPPLHELLAAPDALDRLKLCSLHFNTLAHQPYVGARPLGQADVERARVLLPHIAAGQRGGWAVPDVARALDLAARERPYHPVAEFLDGLTWDGTPRLSRVAEEILDVEKKTAPLASFFLRHWFRAAVARACEPGIPSDGMLVLVGRPTAGPDPELFFKSLVPARFYLDTPAGLPLRGLRRHIRRAWVIFRSDLLSLSPTAAAWLVNHLQETDDPVDSPFAGPGERAPRTTLLVAAADALPVVCDEAFRRRLWPIPVGRKIDFARLKEWRDQLWAEAACSFHESPEIALDPEEEARLRRLTVGFVERDPLEDRLLEVMASFFDHPLRRACRAEGPSMAEIQVRMTLPTGRQSSPLQRRIARIVRANGFYSHQLGKTPYTTIWTRRGRGDVAHAVDVAGPEPE